MAGLLDKKKSREGMGEIQAAPMADIAFLLLIFFLVTTTINVDTGIGMVLPPPLEEEQEPPPVKDRNILKINVNAESQVLIEDEASAVNQVRSEVKQFVLNPTGSANLSESPDDAVVSIKTSSGTPYETYIAVLDEIWMAYFDMWDSEARQLGFANFKAYQASLAINEENAIQERIPANISIAEPVEE